MIDLKRISEWVDVARSIAAVLFIPACCVYAMGMVWILSRTLPNTEAVTLQVVDAFKWGFWGLLANIGLGAMWLQRRDLPDIKLSTPGGLTMEIDNPDSVKVTATDTDPA